MTTSASYLLEPDPSPLPTSPTTSSGDVVPNQAPFTAARGLLLPFQRNQRNDFANGTGSELWSTRVRLLLSTHGPTERGPGEIPWRPNDGAPLRLLRHQNNTPMLREMARHYIIDAFRRSLPGVFLTEIGTPVRAGNVLQIEIRFDVVEGTAPAERGLQAVAEIPIATA